MSYPRDHGGDVDAAAAAFSERTNLLGLNRCDITMNKRSIIYHTDDLTRPDLPAPAVWARIGSAR